MHTLDRECAMVGGICVSVDDCDPEYLSTTKGLCPSNKHNNVECCYRCECMMKENSKHGINEMLSLLLICRQATRGQYM